MKSDFVESETIERYANEVLSDHHSSKEIPIPIELIIEKNLNIQIVALRNLVQEEKIEAYVSGDLTRIYIDESMFLTNEKKSRFALAHELGHLVLHKEIIKSINTELDKWRKFVLGECQGKAPYEVQADKFAGYLLMPSKQLLAKYTEAKKKVINEFSKYDKSIPKDSKIIEYCADHIANIFFVPEIYARIRLEEEILLKRNPEENI